MTLNTKARLSKEALKSGQVFSCICLTGCFKFNWNLGLLEVSLLHIHSTLLWLHQVTNTEESGAAMLWSDGAPPALPRELPGPCSRVLLLLCSAVLSTGHKKQSTNRQTAITHRPEARRKHYLQQGEVSPAPIHFQRTSMKYSCC